MCSIAVHQIVEHVYIRNQHHDDSMFLLFLNVCHYEIMQHEQFSETWYNMGPSELQGAEATKTTT